MLKTVDLKPLLSSPQVCDAIGIVEYTPKDNPDLITEKLLSASDRDRLGRVIPSVARTVLRQSLVARRLWLADHLKCLPAEVQIERDTAGAPYLAEGRIGELSLSRSADKTLVALASGKRIGVDIEEVSDIGWREMLDFACTEEEASIVSASIEKEAGLAPFYRMWCTKEAVLKLAGVGLKGGPKKVSCPTALINGGAESGVRVDDRNILVQILQHDSSIVALASSDA